MTDAEESLSCSLLRVGYENGLLRPTVAFEVLAHVETGGELVTTGIVAEEIGRPTSSVSRAMNRLVDEGLIERVPGNGTYRPVGVTAD